MTSITDGKVSVGRKSTQFHFHDFAALSATRDHYIDSPEFTSNGHRWCIRVYPGGNNTATEGCVSAFLDHLSEGNITIDYQIDIIDRFGTSRRCFKSSDAKFGSFPSKNSTWGWRDFIPRSFILNDNILDSDGALIIVVTIAEEASTVFVPQNQFLKMLTEMYKFNDEATADVCFEVGSCTDKKRGKQKKPKASVTLHAHRSILRKCAPMLADLFGSNDTASITDIKPDVFHHLLYYVYGGEVPEEDLKTHSKDIINAADKYSIVNLKLAAEAAYVESTDITFDNAIDDLLYADSKNCALLKEKVMQFLADNHHEACEKISFTDCPGHVVKDLLIAFSRKYTKDSADANADELTTLCVNDLRRKLDELGLEVDGSREAMIESIKSHAAS